MSIDHKKAAFEAGIKLGVLLRQRVDLLRCENSPFSLLLSPGMGSVASFSRTTSWMCRTKGQSV